ncbi:hypothetical protein PHISP_08030 [Aspergillus sp. HF37]|nr:hypothetical protein PHISP_08030 [Aspergillus sp. HF37]
MNTPLPSTRAFLSDLPSLAADSKVRFLGCVRTYAISTGHLVLEHNYPRTKSDPPSVSVDINALVESLTSEVLRVGAWVNVVGYLRDAGYPSLSLSAGEGLAGADASKMPRPVYVEAVMVFAAGPVALGEYERVLREARNVDRRLGRVS